MSASDNKDFLISLGYDPTDAKAGLEKALEDLSGFKVRAVQVSAELTKENVRLTTEFNAANRRAIEERLADLQKEIATTTGAMSRKSDAEKAALRTKLDSLREEFAASKQALGAFDQQIAKVQQLKTEYGSLRSQIALTRESASVLRSQSRGEASGEDLHRIVSGFTGAGAAQAVGILAGGAALAELPRLLKEIAMSAVESAKQTGEFAKQLEIASAKTGIAVPELQQFASVGKLFGLSVDDAATGMRKFSAAIIGGQGVGDDGITPAANKGATVLKDLGVQIVKTASGATDVAATFAATGEAIGKISDPALRAQAAIDVFGKSGLNFLPLFVQGKPKIEEFAAAFKPYQTNLEGITEAYQAYEIAEEKSALANRALGASFAPLLEKWATFKTLIADTTTLLARKPGRFFEDVIGAAATPGGAGKLAGDIVTAPFLSDGRPPALRPPTAPSVEELEREKRLRQHLTERGTGKQREIESAEQAIGRTTAEGQTRLADARDSLILSPKGLTESELRSAEHQLTALREAAGDLKSQSCKNRRGR